MRPDPQNRFPLQKSDIPSPGGSGFGSSTAIEPSFKELDKLNTRLLTIYLQLGHVNLSAAEAPDRVMQVQEEIAAVIWVIEDWMLQTSRRN